MAKRLHIGLIGGIGVAATLSYYQRLTSAIDGPAEITIVHAQVADLVRNNLADDRMAQAEIYAGLIRRLRDAGCDCAAITSLGGHFCFAETVPLSVLPLVSAVAPLDAHFVGAGLKTVGLLGTGVVMRTRLYGQLEHTRAVVPEGDLETLGAAYQDMAIRGTALPQDREMFFDAARKLVGDQGADAIVLAGTDLNLVFDGKTNPGYPVIDALDVHVTRLAALATGETELSSL